MASHRTALEDAVAALDIDTDSPQQLNVGLSAASPSIWRSPLVGTCPPPARFLGHRQPAKQGTMAGTSPPSASHSGGELAVKPVAPSPRRQQYCAPRPYGMTMCANTSGSFCPRSHGASSSPARHSTSRYASIPNNKGARFSVEEGPVSGTPVEGVDVAGVGDPVPCPSPVERVLARRKRRRRSNLSVSSALLLSASTEDVPMPPVAQRPCTPLADLEDDEDTLPGLNQKLAGLNLR